LIPTAHPCDKGVILSASATAPCSSDAAPWILAATILGSSLAFIDGSVVNLALPALQASLNATVVDVQWVVEAYALLLAALMLVGGSLGDIYGRKRIYIAGIALFSAASTWCGVASNVRQLIFGRALQGIGAALLVPGSLAIISASFEKSKRGRAIGAWSGFTSITAAAGPVLGGFLIEHATWRWAFFINLPLAFVVLVLTLWRVPESRNVRARERLDLLGASLATIGLGGIVYALIESSKTGLNDPSLILALLGGCSALVAFIAVETRSRSPLLPLGLFRSLDFSAVKFGDAVSIQRPEHSVFLFSSQSHSSAGLLGHSRRCVHASVHIRDVFAIATVRRTRRPVWREAASCVRPRSRRDRICPFRASFKRRQLLDDILSSNDCARFGNGDERRAAHDDRDEFSFRRARWDCIGNQQCGFTISRSVIDRHTWHCYACEFRP